MAFESETDLHAELVRRAKLQIRARMKAIRGGHPRAALALRSQAVVEKLLAHPEVQAARGVASFWPLVERGEVDLRSLDEVLRARGVSLYYPFMEPLATGGYRTGFRRTTSSSDLEERGQRFFEPPPSAEVAQAGDIDLVIVPALAVDQRCHRIGYGAGYYDATLADVRPPAKAIIVAYHFQMLAELPAEPHDVPCDFVVTDQGSYSAHAACAPRVI